jgi:photosystem II stability/assembly factor-like uncharacterized protein
MDPSGAVSALAVGLAAIWLSTGATADTGYYSLFRSQDRGQTWARSDSGLPHNTRINAFAVIRDAILAGTDRGIYISRDGGLNWTASGTANSVGRILTFAAIRTSVYAGTDRSGIVVSQDGGVTWAMTAGSSFGKIRSLLADTSALYAGTDARGVFVSRDGGHSWAAMSEGLPGGAQIFSLAGLKGQVFAGLYGKGLYVWSGQAPSWRKVGSVSPLALATSGETLLAGHNPGGIFRSDDLGATWGVSEIAFSYDLGKAPVWELAAGPELAMAGVSSGIYRSEDRGRRWIRARAGLPNASSGIAFLLGRRFVLAAVFIPTKE